MADKPVGRQIERGQGEEFYLPRIQRHLKKKRGGGGREVRGGSSIISREEVEIAVLGRVKCCQEPNLESVSQGVKDFRFGWYTEAGAGENWGRGRALRVRGMTRRGKRV